MQVWEVGDEDVPIFIYAFNDYEINDISYFNINNVS